MVFNATINNISDILWKSVLLMTGVAWKNIENTSATCTDLQMYVTDQMISIHLIYIDIWCLHYQYFRYIIAMKRGSYIRGVGFLVGNRFVVFYYLCIWNLVWQEGWPYKRDGLWWEWPYKRNGLWWEWPYKRRITVVKTPIYPTDFYESTLVANPKIYNFFDLLKSLYSDTKILSKYIPSLQRRW